jgi:DNA invertase Pin-like site-specific DNA recombinase
MGSNESKTAQGSSVAKSTVIYARCSTKTQELDAQRDELIRYCGFKGFSNILILEEKVSAVSTDRKEYKKMMDMVKAGEVERIVIFDLSRLSRKGVADTINTIDFLTKNGVELLSKKEGISFDGQMGMVMASLFSALANIDYQMRREKCRIGIEKAREKNGGKVAGIKGGSKKNTDKRSAIVKMKATGATYKEITSVLGVSPTTIRRALTALAETA